MSHNAERKEKVCLNCNAEIYGRYCHICGQENVETNESFWHLVTHFVNDVTHFDGKFFTTVKYLLLKPGFLSSEYLRGRRASYLHPIRLYVFTSALFFIIFFHSGNQENERKPRLTAAGYAAKKDSLVHTIAAVKNADTLAKAKEALDDLNEELDVLQRNGSLDLQSAHIDTAGVHDAAARRNSGFTKISFQKGLPLSVNAYDSQQQRLPENKRDGFLKRRITHKAILLNVKYHNSRETFTESFKEKFTHSLPQMMFVSMPLAAFILYLLYIRKRKTFLYVSHGIFVIHFYIAAYLFILLSYFFSWLNDLTSWRIFSVFSTTMAVAIFFYEYKALRNFYQQRRAKTLLKFLLFNLIVLAIFVLLALLFLFTSLLQI